MASYMVIVYADLIRKGKKTIEQVPEKLRAEVEAVLNAQAAALFIIEEGGGYHGSHLCDPDCEGEENIRTGPG